MAGPGPGGTAGIFGDCCGDCGNCDTTRCANPCVGTDPYIGCAQQIILFLLPEPLRLWFNQIQDYAAASDCAHAPAAPSLTSADYVNTMNTANAMFAAFDWNAPPLPFSPDEFLSGGVLMCPGMESLRYWLAVNPLTNHYEYRWDNSNRPISLVSYPTGFRYDECEGVTTMWSGLQWIGGADVTYTPGLACPGLGLESEYSNGWPILVASWGRIMGMASMCESVIEQTFDGASAECLPGRTVHQCGAILPAADGCFYAGNSGGVTCTSPGGNLFPGYGPRATASQPCSAAYGANWGSPVPVDNQHPFTSFIGYADWIWFPCADCTCP